MRIPEVSAKAFAREVIRSDRPVLVHFSAAWCKVSLRVGSIIEKLAGDLGTDVKVVHIDSERSSKLCAQLGVRRFPTQMVFDGGVMVDQILGATTAESLQQTVQGALDARSRRQAALEGEISDASFGREVLQADVPVMVVFWDAACALSVRTMELVTKLGQPRAARAGAQAGIKVVPVQAKRVPETAARLGVTRLPVTMVFRDGAVVDTIGGAMSRASVTDLLKGYAAATR